jgi:hypothetical protein
MQSFSKRAAFLAGWNLFWTRPLFLMGVVLVVTAVSTASDTVLRSLSVGSGLLFALNVLAFVVNTILSMGMMLTALRIHDKVETGFADLLEPVPLFWKYVGATLISALCFVVGFVLFIVPGIVAELAFSMALYIVIDKEVGPIAALKASYHLTKGHRLNLLIFIALLVALNMLGAMLVGIGLLVTIPVSLLALVWVYRWLEGSKTTDAVSLGAGSWVTAVGIVLAALVLVGVLVYGAFVGPTQSTSRDIVRGTTLSETQLALSTYYNLNGVYPYTVDELVPQYLYTVPVDPSTGEVLSYRALDNGEDYELCVIFETNDIGRVCQYGSAQQQTGQQFNFGE